MGQDNQVSNDFTKLTEGIHALTVNFARIESKLDTALELKRNVDELNLKLDREVMQMKDKMDKEIKEIKKEVDDVDDTAKEAKHCGEKLDDRFDRLEISFRWAVGIIVPVVVSIGIWILNNLFK